ncbi:MAG: hypothetical protein DRQ35_04825 [Gammaproteobacteria bacterium]|nr:MAG: hypothetical protein DRQ35_04825 [Gammaproteobacteria bacterium]
MIEELKAILELLGDVSQIGGWVLGGWLTFKVIILLSTTGAIVFISTLGIKSLRQVISEWISSSEVKSGRGEKVKDMEIKGICITADGTYEHVVESLKIMRSHVNTASGSYIHHDGADWLRRAINDQITRERNEPNE